MNPLNTCIHSAHVYTAHTYTPCSCGSMTDQMLVFIGNAANQMNDRSILQYSVYVGDTIEIRTHITQL